MNGIVLLAITAGSAISTIGGLIASAIKNRRNKSGKKAARERYTVTVEKDGKAYRIESSSPQAAEDAIKGIIEQP